VEASLARVTSEGNVDTSRWIGVGRLGVKRQLIDGFPHLAWTGGVAFGSSAGGAFGVIDTGLVVGYVNDVIVPFASLTPFVSLPIDPSEVLLRQDTGDDDEERDTPQTTFGMQLALGFKVPIDKVRLSAGVSWSLLHDTRGETEHFFGITGGVELQF
jgi:hypothetical protein